MEMGAAGLLLPNTHTPEQAQALVEGAKYRPMGKRGVSLLRAHTCFEKAESATQYMQDSNADMLLMAQIESPLAMENVEAILSVDGIDAAFDRQRVLGSDDSAATTLPRRSGLRKSTPHSRPHGIHPRS